MTGGGRTEIGLPVAHHHDARLSQWTRRLIAAACCLFPSHLLLNTHHNMTDNLLTLKITGLGHKITLELPKTTTISTLKDEIASLTSLPPTYQRLVCRGKKLDNCKEETLESLSIKNRTSIVLLHNELYANDKEAIDQITSLEKQLQELDANKNSISSEVLQERVTLICCKLDEVDTHGSESLRAMRKALLKKAEALDPSSNTNTDDEKE